MGIEIKYVMKNIVSPKLEIAPENKEVNMKLIILRVVIYIFSHFTIFKVFVWI